MSDTQQYKAVICAAGKGRRLMPYTREKPKPLLKVAGKMIIEYILDSLSDNGITDVLIMTGHGDDHVRSSLGDSYKNCNLTYILNEQYAMTNNIYSVYLAKEYIDEGMIFFNGDLVFEPDMLKDVINNGYENCAVVDTDVELVDDAMKVSLKDERITHIGKKIIAQAHGWSMGIYKLSKEGAQEYFRVCDELFDADCTFKHVSFVVPLQIMASKTPIMTASTSGVRWAEIDTHEDYDDAKQRFGDKEIHVPEFEENEEFFPSRPLSSEVGKLLMHFVNDVRKEILPSAFMKERIQYDDETLHIADESFDLKGKRVFVIGAGKASAAMAKSIEEILDPQRITAGVVISSDVDITCESIDIVFGDHPVPSQRSLDATRRLVSLREQYDMTEEDIVIALISGGGSSLMTLPADELPLKDVQETMRLMIASGMNVHEMTAVKKKLSQVKGGKLAKLFSPAQIISCVLSDVVGDDLDVIASGPLAPDITPITDILKLLEARGLAERLPGSIMQHLRSHDASDLDDAEFGHVDQGVIYSNNDALGHIEDQARALGYNVVVGREIQGEARDVAQNIVKNVWEHMGDKPSLYLYGGETTVTLCDNPGTGGRNQEFILSCLREMKTRQTNHTWAIASIATDGIDYIEQSSGAIIDNTMLDLVTIDEIEDHLMRNDSHTLLKKIGANMQGGATGTNVCDLMFVLVLPEKKGISESGTKL